MTGKTKSKSLPKSYWTQSRDLFNSMFLVAPLFVFYQIGILSTGGVQNGVDFVTRFLFRILNGDIRLYFAFSGLVLIALVVSLVILRKSSQFRPRIWLPIILESTIYALLLSSVINLILQALPIPGHLAAGLSEAGVFSKIVLSVGAGFYEELVFRLLLFSGLVLLCRNVLRLPTWMALFIGVFLSSFVFSGIHYIGPFGDPFMLNSFLFRFFAGVLFAILYRTRGFAVAVYTHAIYDIFVLVVFSQ